MQSKYTRLPGWIRPIRSLKLSPTNTLTLTVCIICLVILILGWVFTNYLVRFGESRERYHFIAEVKTAASFFGYRQMSSLQGKPEDVNTEIYKNILQKLINIRDSNPNYRFIYLMGLRNSDVIFLADAEAPDSSDYSAPGDIYEEPSPELINIFKNGTAFVEGPITDKWGTWVSAIAPIKDHNTGKVVSIIGFDINAGSWADIITLYKTLGISITVSICLIVLISAGLVYRFKAASDMEQAKDKLDAILNTINEGVIVSDGLNRIISINASGETIIGVSSNEVLNKPLESIFKSKSFAEEEWPAQLEEGKEFSFDLELRNRETGNLQFMKTSLAMARDKGGDIIGRVINFHDVTIEREIDRIKSEIISTASHELRTPLTTILGFSELMLSRKNFSEEEKKKYMELIHTQAVTLANLINDMLDLARIEKGHTRTLKKGVFVLQGLIKDDIQIFQQSFPRHTFDLELPAEPLNLIADRDKISQVIKNLLSNAVKFSTEDGEVKIRVKVIDGSALISVWDKGIGMTPEQIEKVFDRFYRVDSSDTAPQGTGLGMSIVKYIVGAHGGEICVDSEVGEGTSVHFTIPLPSKNQDMEPV